MNFGDLKAKTLAGLAASQQKLKEGADAAAAAAKKARDEGSVKLGEGMAKVGTEMEGLRSRAKTIGGRIRRARRTRRRQGGKRRKTHKRKHRKKSHKKRKGRKSRKSRSKSHRRRR